MCESNFSVKNLRKIKVTIVKFQYKKLTSSLSSKKVSGSKK